MNSDSIKRINELARKAKTEGLTPLEKEEQKRLREEYIAEFRNSLRNTLESVVIVDEKGNRRKLNKKQMDFN